MYGSSPFTPDKKKMTRSGGLLKMLCEEESTSNRFLNISSELCRWLLDRRSKSTKSRIGIVAVKLLPLKRFSFLFLFSLQFLRRNIFFLNV